MPVKLKPAESAGLTRAQSDPAGWVRAFLGADLWEKQVEILESVRDNRRTAVKSCHGSGKSFLAARAVIWYLNVFPNSMVISTAPTYNQVRNILWRSVNTAYAGAIRPLFGRVLVDRYEIAPEWYAIGFKAQDTAPDRFQGFHPISGRALVIIDEAAGVATPVYEAIDAVMTSEYARMLLIGNPTAPDGDFYDAFHRNRGMYHPITISADDTPNIRAGQTVRPYLITDVWKQDAIQKHGIDSPYVQSRVYAAFPTVGDKNLIPLAWIERQHEEEPTPSNEPARAGLDVARYGGDENALCIRRGRNVLAQHAWSGMDVMETVGQVRHILRDYPDIEAINVDAIGIGAGVYDRLRELKYPAVEVNVGGAATEEGFANLRHEYWWGLKERFRRGDIVGPFDDLAMGQLSSVRFRYTSSYPMPLIETKDEMRKRGLRSPDRAEAMLLAFAETGTPGGRVRVGSLDAAAAGESRQERAGRLTGRDRDRDDGGPRSTSHAGSRNQQF